MMLANQDIVPMLHDDCPERRTGVKKTDLTAGGGVLGDSRAAKNSSTTPARVYHDMLHLFQQNQSEVESRFSWRCVTKQAPLNELAKMHAHRCSFFFL